MYPGIPDYGIPIFTQNNRQWLAESERARLLRERNAALNPPSTRHGSLARAWAGIIAALTGLVRSLGIRPSEVRGEGTPAGV